MAANAVSGAWRSVPDVAVIGSQAGWTKFIDMMASAHESDIASMIALLERTRQEILTAVQTMNAAKTAQHKGGLLAKDLKPDRFDNNQKSKQSFKQWSDDLEAWLKMTVPGALAIADVAGQLQEWDEVKFGAEAVRAGIAAADHKQHKEELLTILRRLTEGSAR